MLGRTTDYDLLCACIRLNAWAHGRAWDDLAQKEGDHPHGGLRMAYHPPRGADASPAARLAGRFLRGARKGIFLKHHAFGVLAAGVPRTLVNNIK